jgi:multiple antibiotic resistance protein
MLAVLLASFAALIPITNPIGALAAFAGLTNGMDAQHVHRQAWRTGLYVAGILVVFAALGTFILTFFGISLAALQIAGGLVVMHSGFGMLTRNPRPSTPAAGVESKADISFSPMALPLVAGPGAIGVVIGISARNPGLLDRLGVLIASLLIGIGIAVVLRFATPVIDKLGPTGVAALTRVMGFLILAIGVEIALQGVLTAFKL